MPNSTLIDRARETVEPDLVDTKTAAKILSLRNHHTLEVWRSTGRFPTLRYHRVGRAVRYRRADLEEFLNSNSVGGATAAAAEARL